LTIFGGRLRDIHTFLTEERLPEGRESRVRDQMGLTLFAFNRTVFRVELGIEEEVDQPLNLMHCYIVVVVHSASFSVAAVLYVVVVRVVCLCSCGLFIFRSVVSEWQ